MAKKTKKNTPRWKAAPDDAIRLAALRWYALQLESSAICLYATNQTAYKELESVLKRAMVAMNGLKQKFGIADNLEDGCPDGYVLCKDGVCAPMCDGVIGTPPA